MSSEKKSSLLSLANTAMRARDYTTAITLYEQAVSESGEMREQIEFNLQLAKDRLGQIETLSAPAQPIRIKTPPHSLQVATSNFNYKLVETGRIIDHNLKGHIDVVDERFIQGWIYDQSDVLAPVSLDLYINDVKCDTSKADIIRNDVKAAGGLTADCGFRIEHGRYTNLIGHSEIRIAISGTDNDAFSQTIETSILSADSESLSKVAKILKKEMVTNSDAALHWLSSHIIPKLLNDLRSGNLTIPKHQAAPLNQPSSISNFLSIIIPVYEGYQETLDCINSVLKSENTTPYNLIVINDCSPNKKLTKKLQSHSAEQHYTLIENQTNLGFVGTVNAGMRFAENSDVVLLNSDTLVPEGWIDQLVSVAYSDPIIGTVTPFSNNATICSFPNFCQDNELPTGHDVNSVNKIFNEVNNGSSIDLPTAHGFCMFIKHAVIKDIGLFDEKKWGKGYAEENDFSLRADQRGWRNVLALDTFVQHLGSVSFASNTEEFVRKNLQILNGIYPDYSTRVMNFVHLDPALKYRNAVSRALIEVKSQKLNDEPGSLKGFMLFVTLTIGGGTQIATDDIAKHLKKEGVHVLTLTSPSREIWRLSYLPDGIYLDYKIQDGYELLVQDLKSFGVWHVNYHNTIEFGKDVWDIPNNLGCEYDVTIHDYLSICPRVNLMDASRRYCGEPSSHICNACVAKDGTHESSYLQLSDFDGGVDNWRDFFEANLTKARKVFVPSKDVGMRLEKYFPDISFIHRAHPESLKSVQLKGPSNGSVIDVAFLGAIGIHKGYDYLLGCAQHALKSNLPIKFHVIGYTKDDTEIKGFPNIILHGKYTREDLPRILQKSNCRIAAILSVWPETFSYTLSEALNAGLKVITFNMGAPAERLQKGCGILIDIQDDFETICQQIIALSQQPKIKINTGTRYKNYLSDYFELPLRAACEDNNKENYEVNNVPLSI